MSRPFSVRIFLADGKPEGLRIIEKDNWNGCGVVCPRPILKASQPRGEFGKPGVYLLLGESDDFTLPKVYIGEADPVGLRLRTHDAEQDFWTRAIFFVGNLHKAHVQHLESRLLDLARNAKRCSLENRNQPTLPTLSEAETAHAEGFLEEMLLCFGVLGVEVFEQPVIANNTIDDLFLMKIKGKGIEATGYQSANGFVVCKDSQAVLKSSEHLQQGAEQQRKRLIDLGVLVKTENHLIFSQDYEFGSPSTAGQIVMGRSTNGRVEWKDSSGRSLNDLAKQNLIVD